MDTVRAAFVFDEAGVVSLADEVALAVAELAELGVTITVAKTSRLMQDVYRDTFDLLVLDYGGLSTAGGSHAEMQVWSACNYAENHPGSLVVLWSKFTERIYRGELEDTFGHLDNVLLRFERNESAYDFSKDGSRRFRTRLQVWFGSAGAAERTT